MKNSFEILKGKKIIIVIDNLELAGAERVAIMQAKFLKNELDAKVQIWGLRAPGKVSEICDELGIPWRQVAVELPSSGFSHSIKNYARLIRFFLTLRYARPDIIISHLDYSNILCSMMWRYTGASFYAWTQHNQVVCFNPEFMKNTVTRHVPCFIAVAEHIKHEIIEEFKTHPNRVHVVYNDFVKSMPKLTPKEWLEKLGLETESLKVCMVANINEKKDHETLVKAWRIVDDTLKRHKKRARLLLAGYFDTAYEKVKSIVSKSGISDSVYFLGTVDDIPGLLSICDIAVLSTKKEGFPLSVLEYMNAGLPVAGTNDPGIMETLGKKGKPYLTPYFDENALADNIIKLALDPRLRKTLGEYNKKRIELHFSSNRMCKETCNIIANHLQTGPS